MKCNHCNSEWNTGNEIKVCPFCGKELFSDSDFSTIENTLKFVVATYGIEIYSQPSRLISYLGDYAPQLSNERRLLKTCLESGVIKELIKVNDCDLSEKKLVAAKSVTKLVDAYFVNRDWAEKAVEWVVVSMGWGSCIVPTVANTQKVKVIHKKGNFRTNLVIDDGDGNYTGYVDSEGQPHGQGKCVYSDGSIYNGTWDHGYWHGHGRLDYSESEYYEGDFCDGFLEGRGTMYYEDGSSWTGIWKEGSEWDGYGTVYDENFTYVGQVSEHKCNGKGRISWKNGRSYEGEFKDGDRHGFGTLFFEDGSTWTGEWKEREPWNGSGVFKYDNSTNTVPVVDGKHNGFGKVEWNTGSFYEGYVVDNEFHGKGKLVDSEGTVQDGEFKNHEFFSGSEYDATGKLIATYKDGERTDIK